MPSRKSKGWLNQEADAAVAVAEVNEQAPESERELTSSSNPPEPNWKAELAKTKEAASAALEALDDWHRKVDKLSSQLNAVRAEQQTALADHSTDSDKRVERIATAQLREQVITADLEFVRGPRNQLVDALRAAAKRCWPPATAVYDEARARRVADVMAELRQTLDPGIVHGLESIEEPGHSMSVFRSWPSMLEYTAGLHSKVRAIAALKVVLPNFDSFSQIVSDEELGYLLATASNYLQAIGKLQAQI